MLASGRVLDELAYALREHGQASPIRGLSDPRLAHPDLLLVAGWERVEVEGGFGYRLVSDESADTRERWEQCYVQQPESTVLMTRAGHKVQIITAGADGSVRSTITYEY